MTYTDGNKTTDGIRIEQITVFAVYDDAPDVSYLEDRNTDTEWKSVTDASVWKAFRREFGAKVRFNLYPGRREAIGRLNALYTAKDAERLQRFVDGDLCMVGIRAEAQISYPCGQGSRRLENLSSGGLYGIESDSGSYFNEVAADEIDGLREHLQSLGVDISTFDGAEIVTAGDCEDVLELEDIQAEMDKRRTSEDIEAESIQDTAPDLMLTCSDDVKCHYTFPISEAKFAIRGLGNIRRIYDTLDGLKAMHGLVETSGYALACPQCGADADRSKDIDMAEEQGTSKAKTIAAFHGLADRAENSGAVEFEADYSDIAAMLGNTAFLQAHNEHGSRWLADMLLDYVYGKKSIGDEAGYWRTDDGARLRFWIEAYRAKYPRIDAGDRHAPTLPEVMAANGWIASEFLDHVAKTLEQYAYIEAQAAENISEQSVMDAFGRLVAKVNRCAAKARRIEEYVK